MTAALALAGIAALATPALAMADPGTTPSGPVPSSSASSPVDGPAASSEPATGDEVGKAAASPEADSPTLTVDVSADKTSVHPGEVVTYTITVKNVHPTATIHDVVVRSPDVSACDRDLGDMTPGRTVEYTCKGAAPSDTFRMRVRVRGYDSGGVLISRHDNDVTIHVVPVVSQSPSHSPSSPSHSASSSSPAAPGQNAGNGKGLAVTGTTATVLATTGAALLAGGAGLWILARRRNAAEG